MEQTSNRSWKKVVLFHEKFYNKAEQEVQGEHILKIGEEICFQKIIQIYTQIN